MKLRICLVVVALAFASAANAQTRKITPKGAGGFSSGSNQLTSDIPEGQREGPKENRSSRVGA